MRNALETTIPGLTSSRALPASESATSRDLLDLSAAGIAAAMLATHAAITSAVRSELPAIGQAIEAIAERMAQGGRLIFLGAGHSGRLGLLQASELGPTFGIAPGSVIALVAGLQSSADPRDLLATDDAVEDDVEAAVSAVDAVGLARADAVIGMAASGSTPWTLAALERAAARGAVTVAIACTHPSALANAATIAIHPVVGAEVLAGSTRLAAGSAIKLVLDMLTTGAMVRLGRVHRDRMIDVRPTNDKLRGRAVSIVAGLTSRSESDARDSLMSVGWWPRAAIVRLVRGLDAAAAGDLAARHRFLSDALATPVAAAQQPSPVEEPH